MKIKIRKSWYAAEMEQDERGHQAGGYWGLNIQGRGKLVAVIDGPVQVVDIGFGVQGGRLDDGKSYAPRTLIAFARRGDHGLSITEVR